MGRPPIEDPLQRIGKTQRRVAQLKAADMTTYDIARFLDCSEETVSSILREPKVQRLILKLGAMTADDLRPKINEVNEMVHETLKEAFEIEVAIMRRQAEELDVKNQQLAHAVASSILDRGGVSAPKRFESKSMNLNLGSDNVNAIAAVLKELDAI